LVGHTDLGFIYREHGIRTGWFHPSELGDKLMPAATGVAVAMRESRENGRDFLTDPDIASACDHERALELELRGPNGAVIDTENIAIIDTHHLLALADRELQEAEGIEPLSADDEAMIEEWLADREPDEPWRESEEFPRYQIQAYLVDHDAIP
jgi:hypothetical protein